MRFGLSLPYSYPALAERVIAREIHLLRAPPQTSCTGLVCKPGSTEPSEMMQEPAARPSSIFGVTGLARDNDVKAT